METKQQLVDHIREWINLESEISKLQKIIKEKKEKKKNLTNTLVDVMKTNEIDCFDINNGKLVYTQNKTKSCISKKLLLSALSNYTDNKEEVEKITNHILDSRETKINEKITHKINKK
jgi:hypothetical protein